MSTQKWFDGKFDSEDQSQTQQARRPFVAPFDFYEVEHITSFRKARAHVVACSLGGFGVLRFNKLGEVVRLGYDHERPCKGEYTREQAEQIARG
jgi:hypothetical protein